MRRICKVGFFFLILWCAGINAYGYEKKKINIILIEVDSLRADHLGCYGYNLNISPNIDKFAKGANLYLNCFSPATWTLPSNFSLLTSLYLPQHKADKWDNLVDSKMPNIINVLYENGYSLGIFGNQSFLLKSLKENFGSMFNGYKFARAPLAINSAFAWIESQQAPFFLWMSFLEPHWPYRPLLGQDKLFLQSPDIKLQMSKAGKYCWAGGRHFFKNEVNNKNGMDMLAYNSARYDASIRYIDSKVGIFLKRLEKKSCFKDSLIIFISDHGESLGEHHLYFSHLWHLFNEIIKVPLIVKFPGQVSGCVIKNDAGLIDVFPTILDEIGIKVNTRLEGIPLRDIRNTKREFFSFHSLWYYCFIYDKWKLIKYPGGSRVRNAYMKLFFSEYPAERYQLVNFKDDPAETLNFAKTDLPAYDEMKIKIMRWRSRSKSFKYKRSSFKMDEQMKSRLKSLGYLN